MRKAGGREKVKQQQQQQRSASKNERHQSAFLHLLLDSLTRMNSKLLMERMSGQISILFSLWIIVSCWLSSASGHLKSLKCWSAACGMTDANRPTKLELVFLDGGESAVLIADVHSKHFRTCWYGFY